MCFHSGLQRTRAIFPIFRLEANRSRCQGPPSTISTETASPGTGKSQIALVYISSYANTLMSGNKIMQLIAITKFRKIHPIIGISISRLLKKRSKSKK